MYKESLLKETLNMNNKTVVALWRFDSNIFQKGEPELNLFSQVTILHQLFLDPILFTN